MAMKTYKKKNLKYKDGYIMDGNRIVELDNEIVDMLNGMETELQRARFEAEASVPEPVHREFARQSERKHPCIDVVTPVLDKSVERTMQLMDEIDSVELAGKVNRYLHERDKVVQFARSKRIIGAKNDGPQHRFDLPTIGNPLKLTGDDIVDIACFVHGIESDE